MARGCTICDHPKRSKIDDAIREALVSKAEIGRRFKVSARAVGRHESSGHVRRQLLTGRDFTESWASDAKTATVPDERIVPRTVPKLSRGTSRGGNKAAASVEMLRAEVRQREAVKLRLQRMGWDDIADALKARGFEHASRTTVFRDVTKYRKMIAQECLEDAADMVSQAAAQLDASAGRIHALLSEPSEAAKAAEGFKPLSAGLRLKAEDALGKVHDRHAKLFGYAAPDKQEIDDGRKTREQQMAEVAQGTGLSVDDIAAVFGEAKG